MSSFLADEYLHEAFEVPGIPYHLEHLFRVEVATVNANTYGEFDAFLKSRFGKGQEESFKEDLREALVEWYGLFKKNYKAATEWKESKEEAEPFPASSPIDPLLGTYQKVLNELVESLKRSPELSPSGDISGLDITKQREKAAYLLRKQAFFLISMTPEAYLATVTSYDLSPTTDYDLSALAYLYLTNSQTRNGDFIIYSNQKSMLGETISDWRKISGNLNQILDLQMVEGKGLPSKLESEVLALVNYTTAQAKTLQRLTKELSDPSFYIEQAFVVDFVRRAKMVGHLMKNYVSIKGKLAADLNLIQQTLEFVYSKNYKFAEVEAKPMEKIN